MWRGLRAFARRRRTYDDIALPDPDRGYRHCVDLARRGAEADLSGWRRGRARRRGAGEHSQSRAPNCTRCAVITITERAVRTG